MISHSTNLKHSSLCLMLVLSSLSLSMVGCSGSLRGLVYQRGTPSAFPYPAVQYGHIDLVEAGASSTTTARLKVRADDGKEYWFNQPLTLDWAPQVGDRVKLFFSDNPPSSVTRVIKANQAISATQEQPHEQAKEQPQEKLKEKP